MQPIYVSKTLAAASSSGIGTISTAAVPVTTINTATLDTARRVVLWSTTAADISATFTVTGTNESGNTFSEAVIGSTNGGSVATIGDFKTVTSVSVSSAPLGVPVTLGTNTQGGTIWKLYDNYMTGSGIVGALTFSTTANSMVASFETTLDDVFGFYPNPNQVLNKPPTVFISTALSSAVVNTQGAINLLDNPISAWRVTLTSSSSSAGSVFATVMQSGA